MVKAKNPGLSKVGQGVMKSAPGIFAFVRIFKNGFPIEQLPQFH
jgi:hypothetical protein